MPRTSTIVGWSDKLSHDANADLAREEDFAAVSRLCSLGRSGSGASPWYDPERRTINRGSTSVTSTSQIWRWAGFQEIEA